MHVYKDDTVRSVMLRIADQFDIPVDSQKIIYRGALMTEDRTLLSYGVRDTDYPIVYLTIRMRGN